MRLEELGEKLEKAGKKLADAKADVNESFPGAFEEVTLAERPPAGDGSCSRMDFFAEQKDAKDAADLKSQPATIDACSRLDILAEQLEGAELSTEEQTWLEEQPEQQPAQNVSFKGKLNPVCITGLIKCSGCAGDLMGSKIECRGGNCLAGKADPKCPNGKRP